MHKTTTEPHEQAGKLRKQSQTRDVLRRLRKNKLAMISLGVIILIVLAAVFADYITPYDYDKQVLSERFIYPCAAHPLGTDNYGRDILTRVIYGGRVSLLVAVAAVGIGLFIGGAIGAVSAYYGGAFEDIVMRCMDILMSIPPFLLAISISASLGQGIINTSLAIGIGMVPTFARVLRSSVISIRNQEYIEAARLCGGKSRHIILRHLVPNSLAPIIVQATLQIGSAIFAISSLSFIGLGVQPPTPEWGSMLSSGRSFIRDFYPIVTFPGIAIVITLLAFNLLGDGLRDALDPKLKR